MKTSALSAHKRQRTPAELAAMLTNIRAGLLANKSVREIARALEQKETYIYTLMARRLGVQKVMLLPGERQLIESNRAHALAGQRGAR